MRPLLALACLLATVAPVGAVPFDTTATYTVGDYCLSYPGVGGECETPPPGPLDLFSNRFPMARLGASLFPAPAVDGAFTFTPWWGASLPPVPEDCHGCRVVIGGTGHYLGTSSEGTPDPFDGVPTARLRLVEEGGQWALDQPDLAHTPEPATLLLMGGTLAVAGWVARKRRA